MASPVLHLACGFLPIPHPLEPPSCISNTSIRLQPNLFFLTIHISRCVGRILIRLLRSSWVSFDQDYDLPKETSPLPGLGQWAKVLFLQHKRRYSLRWSRQPPSIVSGSPLMPSTGSHPGPLRGVGWQMPCVQSDEGWAGHTTPVKTCRCLLMPRNVATCKSSWKSFTVTSAQLADVINFLFLLWALTSYPVSSRVTAVWKTRPRFVQPLWNAIRSPSTASGSWSWKERGGKRDLPALQQCVDFEVLGHLLCPPPPEGL